MRGGWLKLYRQATQSPELANDVAALGLWCWLLMQAAHKPVRVYRGKGGRPVDLAAGQLVFSASSVPGLTRKRVDALLKRWEKAGMIRVQTRRDTGHTIDIVKWLDFQGEIGVPEKTTDKQSAYNGQTRDIQGTTAKEREESREEKNLDSPPAGGSSSNGKYRWEGDVIRLTEKDFGRWEQSFGALDLPCQLASLDAYLASPESSDAERQRWFHFVAGALKNRNEDARAKERFAAKTGTQGGVNNDPAFSGWN